MLSIFRRLLPPVCGRDKEETADAASDDRPAQHPPPIRDQTFLSSFEDEHVAPAVYRYSLETLYELAPLAADRPLPAAALQFFRAHNICARRAFAPSYPLGGCTSDDIQPLASPCQLLFDELMGGHSPASLEVVEDQRRSILADTVYNMSHYGTPPQVAPPYCDVRVPTPWETVSELRQVKSLRRAVAKFAAEFGEEGARHATRGRRNGGRGTRRPLPPTTAVQLRLLLNSQNLYGGEIRSGPGVLSNITEWLLGNTVRDKALAKECCKLLLESYGNPEHLLDITCIVLAHPNSSRNRKIRWYLTRLAHLSSPEDRWVVSVVTDKL